MSKTSTITEEDCLSLIQANPLAYPIIYKQVHRNLDIRFLIIHYSLLIINYKGGGFKA